MRALLIITIFFLVDCSGTKNQINNNKAIYFYFDPSNNDKMIKYHSYKDGPIKYLYKIADVNNIIFTPKKGKILGENRERVKISTKDTVKLNVKNYEWLKTYSSNWKNIVDLRHTKKDLFIIEKDTIDNNLYLINVIYIEEID
jgi:hypothetical protein